MWGGGECNAAYFECFCLRFVFLYQLYIEGSTYFQIRFNFVWKFWWQQYFQLEHEGFCIAKGNGASCEDPGGVSHIFRVPFSEMYSSLNSSTLLGKYINKFILILWVTQNCFFHSALDFRIPLYKSL